MSDKERRNQAVATATFGFGGVAGGGALRHAGLADSYGENRHSTRPRTKRPTLLAERRLVRTPYGRKKYLAGAALAALSAPAATKGAVDLWNGGKRRTFVEEGVSGVAQSLRERNSKDTRHAPVGLQARNYAVGAAATGASAAGAHYLMRNSRIPHGGRASIAAVGSTLAGLGSLPTQRKLAERSSKGKYTATATGLKRVVEPVNHGARHGTRLAKRNDAVTGMSRTDELKAIRRKRRTANVNAVTSAGGVGSLALLGAAALPRVPNRGRLVRAATALGTGSAGVGAVNGLEGAHLARRDLKARERVLTDASKSFLPGRGYVPATQAGKKALRQGFKDRKASGEVDELLAPARRNPRRTIYQGKQIAGKGKVGTVRVYPEGHPAQATGGAGALLDGRGGGVVFADTPLALRHELAHIKPRRNPTRYMQRASDPFRHGREEGRAEFIAQGRAAPTYPGYTDRPERWRAGYDDVQGRMARAKMSKALGVIRAPRVRRGFLRQTRSATGISTTTVRGGLIR